MKGDVLDPRNLLKRIASLERALRARTMGHKIVLPDGKVDPSMVDINQHFFEGTFADNSPSAGYVAWSAVEIIFKGVTYTVANGNTNLKYIYWEKATPTVFGAVATFPGITSDDVVVAINNSGTHRMIMMRGGLVSTALLDELSVTAQKVAALAIGTPKLQALAVTTEKINAGAVVAEKMTVSTLSSIVADLGLVIAGELRLGTGTPGVNFTGIRIFKANSTYRVAGYNADVLQAYLDSDGALKAGGGNVTLDADGILLLAGDSDPQRIVWKYSSAETFGIGYSPTGAAIGAKIISVGAVVLGTGAALGLPSPLDTSTIYAGGHLNIQVGSRLQYGDSNTESWEDASSNLSFKDANAGTKTLSQLAQTGNEVTGGEQSVYVVDGTKTSVTVTYDEALSGTPDAAAASIRCDVNQDPAGILCFIRSYTSTQCVVQVRNYSGADRTFYVNVVAVKV